MKPQYAVRFVGHQGIAKWLDTWRGWELYSGSFRVFGSRSEAKRAARKTLREGKHVECVARVEIVRFDSVESFAARGYAPEELLP